MKRQIFIIFLLLFGVGILNAAGARRTPAPVTSKDPLSWLGPVPSKLSDSSIMRRWIELGDKVRKDVVDTDGVNNFICKTPADVGPVPMMDAVERYMDGAPDSRYDEQLMRGLYQAAAKGNWLARVQLFHVLSNVNDEKAGYRALQLAEWMQKKKLGQLYAVIGKEVMASGYYSDLPGVSITRFDMAAAMQQSYVAQDEVGKALSKSDDPALAAVGRKMLACASGSLGAYRRFFNGEAEQAREHLKKEKELATYTPVHHAVLTGDAARLAKVLADGGVDINAKTGGGYSAIALALLAKRQSRDIVGLLIRHGADIATHGAIDENASLHDKATLLNAAVNATPVDPAIIALLIEAGADPFKTNSVNEYIFKTPFGESFNDYDSGKNTAILEQFLATGKLDPTSQLAIEYLERAAEYPAVLERLIAYGISPERSEEILPELVSRGSPRKDDQKLTVLLDRLLARYPVLRTQLHGKAGFKALEDSVSQCRLELAGYFLDHGTPVSMANRDWKDDLLSNFLTHCDGDRPLEQFEIKRHLAFLARLKQRRYDVNQKSNDRCPVWLASGRICTVPSSDEVVASLLDMGADPFLLHPDQGETALAQAISRCRMPAVDLLLAKAPQRLDEQGIVAVELALKATDRLPAEYLHCPADFLPKTALRLKALLARR